MPILSVAWHLIYVMDELCAHESIYYQPDCDHMRNSQKYVRLLFQLSFIAWLSDVTVTLAAPPQVTMVEFVVGDYLKSEGGTAEKEEFPLLRPFGIDFDSKGTLYVVELEGGRLHALSPRGELQVISGDGSRSYKGDGGPVAKATYNGMHNIAITSDDRIFVSDTFNHAVREIDLEQNLVSTLTGNGKPGGARDRAVASEAQYNYLMCITLTVDESALLIADLKNSRIRRLDLSTQVVTTVAGNGKKGVPKDGSNTLDNPLVDPRAAAADAMGNLYILERNGHALRVVTPDGSIHTVAGNGQKGYQDGPGLTAQFGAPKHLCVDQKGRVYIADDLNGAIRCYDPQNKQVTTLLGRGVSDSKIRLKNPHGVTIQGDALYVCDTSQNRLIKLTLKD